MGASAGGAGGWGRRPGMDRRAARDDAEALPRPVPPSRSTAVLTALILMSVATDVVASLWEGRPRVRAAVTGIPRLDRQHPPRSRRGDADFDFGVVKADLDMDFGAVSCRAWGGVARPRAHTDRPGL